MNFKLILISFFTLLFLGSCRSYEKVPYFQDIKQVRDTTLLTANEQFLRLQIGDRLNITVTSSLTPEQAVQYNLPLQVTRVGASGVASGGQSSLPYCIDTKGNVDIPGIGIVKAAGYTREELGEQITKILVNRRLLNDAVVTVEVLNMHVNVIGEVNRPGRIPIERDQITLLEAIAMAGDLTILGERTNVLVLRRVNGEQKAYRVDLTSSKSLYESPVYQLRQNDVVYVEPNVTRQRQSTPWSNSWQTPSTYLSITSVLVSVAVLISNLMRR